MQTNPESAAVEAVAVVMQDSSICWLNSWLMSDNYVKSQQGDKLYPQSALDALRGEVKRLVKALDEAACELSAAGQALAEFEGFEFRQKAAIDRAYAASQKAHDANGYTEALAKVTP